MMLLKNLKCEQLTIKEMNSISGGDVIRFVVTCENDCSVEYAGLSHGIYIKNTETGAIYNILGTKMK